MSTLTSLIESIAEIIRLGSSIDMGDMSFEVGSDDIERDLDFGRS